MAKEENKSRILDIAMEEYDLIRIHRTDERAQDIGTAVYIHFLSFAGQPVTMGIRLENLANFQGLPVSISYTGLMARPSLVKV